MALAVYVMFALRFLLGLVESPAFPANGRIVAAWFPTAERGTATAVFNSAQYFATVLFAPIMGWITHALGWQYVFYFMGVIGFVLAAVWFKVVHSPKEHPRVSRSELDHIERGGALVNMDELGLAGAIFNCVGNIAGIVTPIVFGYIVAATGSYGVGLWFVGRTASPPLSCSCSSWARSSASENEAGVMADTAI